MPKKTKKESEFKQIIKNVASKKVFDFIKDYIKDFADKTQQFFLRLEKRVLHELFASIIFITGIIFLIISIAFLIKEYLRLTTGWSFFIIALILIIISLFVKLFASKEEVKFE